MTTLLMQVKGLLPIDKMSEINIHKYFLNTLWEFTRGVEENKGSFIEKARKVCKTFKVKSLKTPKLDVPAKKQHTIFFTKICKRQKKS